MRGRSGARGGEHRVGAAYRPMGSTACRYTRKRRCASSTWSCRMLLTALVALPVAAASRRYASFERTLARVTGWISIAFGLFLTYEIGFVEGLFLEDTASLSNQYGLLPGAKLEMSRGRAPRRLTCSPIRYGLAWI
jgi:hypothetical protein